MRVPVLLAGQSVVRDAETNQMSVFNILETVTPAGYPFVIQHVTLFAMIERDGNEPGSQEIELAIQLNTDTLLATPVTVEFGGGLRNRTVLHVNGLQIETPGQMMLQARLDGEVLASYRIDIAPANPAVGPPDPSPAASQTQIN